MASQGSVASAVVHRWVERWCAAQGVAVKVTDVEAVGRASTLLGEGRRPSAPDSEATPEDAGAP